MAGLGLMSRRRAIASSPVKNISLVKEYNRLVVKNGAYFITDYFPSNYDRISFRMVPDAYPSLFLGARKGMGVVVLATNSSSVYMAWDSDSASQINADWTQRIEREFGMLHSQNSYRAIYRAKGAIDYVAIKSYSGTPTEVLSKVPLYLCTSLLLNSDNGVDTRYFQGVFYGCQVHDSRTGDMKHDFVPAIYDSAVAGIYDRITGTFFYNSGAGELTADNEE